MRKLRAAFTVALYLVHFSPGKVFFLRSCVFVPFSWALPPRMSGFTITSSSLSHVRKAHAVLTWTIMDSRVARVANQRESGSINSGDLLLQTLGVPVSSSLRCSMTLILAPAKPAEIRFALLGEEVDKALKLEGYVEMKVLLPNSVDWLDVTSSGKTLRWPYHADVFTSFELRGVSEYVSTTGSLALQAHVDFVLISPGPGRTKSAAGVCFRQAELYRSGDSADFSLISSDGKAYPVHTQIVAAHSSVFKALFKDTVNRQATIEDLDGSTLDVLLKFIYCGDAAGVEENPEKILAASDKYQIVDLRNYAAEYLSEHSGWDWVWVFNLNLENAFRSFDLVDRRNSPALTKAVSEFLPNHWETLRGTPYFVQYEQTHGAMCAVIEAAWRRLKKDAAEV